MPPRCDATPETWRLRGGSGEKALPLPLPRRQLTWLAFGTPCSSSPPASSAKRRWIARWKMRENSSQRLWKHCWATGPEVLTEAKMSRPLDKLKCESKQLLAGTFRKPHPCHNRPQPHAFPSESLNSVEARRLPPMAWSSSHRRSAVRSLNHAPGMTH